MESLPITSGPLAGTSILTSAWQKRFVNAVYRTDRHGKRKVRTAVLSLDGNGKTKLAAALALCATCPVRRLKAGARLFSAANDRFQAGRIFNEMVAIITRVPWLNARINIIRFRKNSKTWRTAASMPPCRPMSDQARPFAVVCLYDELGQATSRDLLDALDTAMGGRAEPLMVVISTQAAATKRRCRS